MAQEIMHNYQIHLSVEPNIVSQTWKWSLQVTIAGEGIYPGDHWLKMVCEVVDEN